MNETTFLKELNSEENKNGEQTYEILNTFFNEENQSIGFLNRFKFLKQVFFKKDKTILEVISENMDNILSKTDSSDFLKVFGLLAMNNETRDYVKNNMQQILEKTLSTKNARTIIYNMSDFFIAIRDFYGKEFAEENKKTFITNNIDSILNDIDKSNLLEHIGSLIGISGSIDTKVNRVLGENKNIIVEEIIRQMEQQDFSVVNDVKNVIKDNENIKKVLDMIEKYMDLEHVRWIDIKKVPKSGRHKDIYQIGTKVFRVGGIKEKKQLPYSSRVLPPIESKQLLNINLPYAVVEIIDKADRPEKEDFENESFREEVYQLYKELKHLNITWIDAPHSFGFKRGAEKTLQNMIILDADSLYNSEDIENLKERPWSEYSKLFEERWKREREEKLAKLNPQHIEMLK